MSLTREGFEAASKNLKKLNKRANKLFKKLKIRLKHRVQMDHWGNCYLFGQPVAAKMSDEEICEIITNTPKEHYNGNIGSFGTWHPIPGVQSIEEKQDDEQ